MTHCCNISLFIFTVVCSFWSRLLIEFINLVCTWTKKHLRAVNFSDPLNSKLNWCSTLCNHERSSLCWKIYSLSVTATEHFFVCHILCGLYFVLDLTSGCVNNNLICISLKGSKNVLKEVLVQFRHWQNKTEIPNNAVGWKATFIENKSIVWKVWY